MADKKGIKNYEQDNNYHTTSTKTGSSIFQPGSKDIEDIIKSNNIVNRLGANWWRRFSRNGIIDPYNTITTTKEYVFITKPDLHLYNMSNKAAINPELASYPFFKDAFNRYQHVCQNLSYSYAGDNDSPFMAILSNALSSEVELPTISADSIDTNQNLYGTKLTYRGSSIKSDEDHEFTIEFTDTKYLEVYMLFKIFDEYERLKWQGVVSPPSMSYITNRVLHDQMALYKIVVGEDGMSIIYWARMVGVYPTGCPRDAFSNMNNSEEQKLSVNWKGQFVRDMDPIILSDFNKITSAYRRKISTGALPMYNNAEAHVEGSWSSCPYIINSSASGAQSKKSKMMRYALRWAR